MHKKYDYNEDVPRFVEDMDIRRWLPFGAEEQRIGHLPGLDNALLTHYTIFWAKKPDAVVGNDCIAGLGMGTHNGNILVVRHGRRVPSAVANISSVERTLVDILLERCAALIRQANVPLTATQVATTPPAITRRLRRDGRSLDRVL